MIDRIGPRRPPRLFIREWMRKRELTQTAVATLMDCGTGTVSKLISGKMEMTTYWLAGFAEALQVEPPDLFRDPNTPTQQDLLRGVSPAKQAEIVRVIQALKAG
jgi:transcriptional regulator with XRE-family HTH domain